MQFPTYQPVFSKTAEEGPKMNESQIPAPIVPRELRATKGPAVDFGQAIGAWQSQPGEPSDVPLPIGVRAFQKDDATKPPLDMLPFDALTEVARVMAYGAWQAPRPDGSKGYGRDNWRQCTDVNRYDAAMLRHYAAIQRGELVDPESGLPHRAHLACCALFALGISR